MNARELEKGLQRLQAEQDQEVAVGADWLRDSDVDVLRKFFNALNEDTSGGAIRNFPPKFLEVTRHLALIGFYEIAHSAMNRSENTPEKT